MLNGLFSFSLLLTLALAVYLIWFSGVLNIALDGTFLWAVFSAFYFLQAGYSLPLVLVFTILSTSLILGLFYGMHFGAGINENFIGILINIFVLSLLDFLNQTVFNKQGILLFTSPVANLVTFRVVMVILFLSLFLGMSYFILKTPLGLRLRLVRSPAVWKQERGISVGLDRLFLFGGASVLISLSGLALLISLNAYTVGLGSGMGWLGLFALLLGFYRMAGIFMSSAFLAIALLVSYWVQEKVGFHFSKGLPYLSAFLAYGLISWWNARRAKAKL